MHRVFGHLLRLGLSEQVSDFAGTWLVEHHEEQGGLALVALASHASGKLQHLVDQVEEEVALSHFVDLALALKLQTQLAGQLLKLLEVRIEAVYVRGSLLLLIWLEAVARSGWVKVLVLHSLLVFSEINFNLDI